LSTRWWADAIEIGALPPGYLSILNRRELRETESKSSVSSKCSAECCHLGLGEIQRVWVLPWKTDLCGDLGIA
jgi:hypothetical protein